jgi:RNA recognition motif-containing protein
MVKLFVGGFPLDIEELELAKLFGPHGDISTVKIVRDKKTRICKGYAFIEMTDRIGAENAAEALNGSMMEGKALTVNINEETIVEDEPIYTNTRHRANADYRKADNPVVEPKKKRPRIVNL